MKKLTLTGKITVDLKNVYSTIVRKQGKDSTSGSAFVPLEWFGKKVVVILVEEGDVKDAKNSDYQKEN